MKLFIFIVGIVLQGCIAQIAVDALVATHELGFAALVSVLGVAAIIATAYNAEIRK